MHSNRNLRARRRVLAYDVGPPPENEWAVNGITTADTTWCMAHLTWANGWGQREPLLLQRREDTAFTTPNLGAAQGYDNFIWLGHGPSVTRYKDVHAYTKAGTTFYYRITAVLNLAAVRKSGAAPVFGDWLTGKATLDALPGGWVTLDVTQAPYNVVADNATNGWAGIVAAADAAAAAGGGVVQLPAGTIRCWPTDGDVVWDGTYLYLEPGDSAASSFLNNQLSNVVVQGQLDNQGAPSTTLNMRLWHDKPATNYLVVLNKTVGAGGDPADDGDISTIRRYGFWQVGSSGVDVENVQLRRLKVDGTATPVNTGKDWQTLNGLRHQWDTSHKLMYGFHNSRNWLLEDLVGLNWRGENIYNGGFGCEAVKLVRCKLSQSNSSITSFSGGVEYEDCYFADASNALIENVPHSLDNDDGGAQLVSAFTGLDFWQDTIIRNLRGRCLDQSAAGVFKNLPGAKTFSGIHVFNQKDTYQTVTDTSVEEFWDSAFAPWYECEDVFTCNLTLKNPARADVRFLDFRPGAKVDYKLTGGMENVWMLDTRVELNQLLGNGGALFYCTAGLDSMNDTWLELLRVTGNGHVIRRVMQDQYTAGTGRSNFVLKDWSWTNSGTDAEWMIVDLTVGGAALNNGSAVGTRILPEFEGVDFFEQVRVVTPTDARFRIQWNTTRLRSDSSDTDFYARAVNVSLLPVGQVFTLKAERAGDTVRLAADGSWNTWSSERVIGPGQSLAVTVVNDGGTRKLEV